MSITLALSVLAMAQGSFAVLPEAEGVTTHDVAYDMLAQGEAQAAIDSLEEARARTPDDPALLINLGSAYAAMGDYDRAAFFYEAAKTSQDRYQLELADGRWIDSRKAASLALETLDRPTLALK